MPRFGSTSLWKAYGLNEMPGLSSMNRHLKYTHGGGDERSEGMASYSVPWGQPLAQVANAWEQPGAAILKTGHAGVYVQNRYDAVSNRNAGNIPGFSPFSASSPSEFQGISAAHVPGGGVGGFTTGNPQNPGTIGTQSSASSRYIQQRYLPDGQFNFSTNMRSEPRPPEVMYARNGPSGSQGYNFQDAPLLASDARIREMRELGGGPTLAEAQQGWEGLRMARREAAMSSFSRANDSAQPSGAGVVEARAFTSTPETPQTITLVIPTQTLEIAAIVGGLLCLLILGLAVKGLLDLLLG